MATNLGRLALEVEADLSQLERGLDRAEQQVVCSGRRMGTSIEDAFSR